MPLKLGELLLRNKLITKDQLDKALELQKTNNSKLGYNLVKMGFVSDEEIATCLSKQFGISAINLSHFEIDQTVLDLVPVEVCRKYDLIPVNRTGAVLTVAMSDPTNIRAMDEINFICGYQVEPVVASEYAIKESIDKYYGSTHALELKQAMQAAIAERDGDSDIEDLEVLEESTDVDLAALERQTEDAPVVKLVNKVLYDALNEGASDIHVEPYEKEFRVRYRIDGVLYVKINPPLKLRDAITSRIKIMAKLDIAEKRLPQDGRIKIKTKHQGRMKELDYRVSVIPTLYGEKIVLRLLDKDNLKLDMTKLGLEAESLRRLEKAILKPYGMILVTGPTGSGKTNTLYSAMSRINTPEINILTAEDPVEFNITGINQVQMKEQIGLNFAAALRSFLRQDPNIILVGEIRDFETAEIAIKAALTGHLVLSTLHTNDAPSTVNRLMNMGIEPFLVASSVLLIVAQRLIRKICSECKEEYRVPLEALIDIGFSEDEARDVTIFKGRGCPMCGNTGYKGRVGLFEVLEVSDNIRELILVGASAIEIRRKAVEEGMIALRASGLEKLKVGLTTIEEVLRETVA
ncbi:type IV-A pilus assembly ATPase PilB [bacterium]|nr:type IV-A pilus assembly ATPase PilB [bacterium]MCI0611782.1 type IV-A pilus assembly ATPase PilB [bacterium]